MFAWIPLLLTFAPGAFAEEPAPAPVDTARAKELYENGAELYAEGLYEEAILAWKEGYELSLLPDFLFNIAGAQERIGEWRNALDTLSKYRAYASTEERETLARRIRNLEERIAAETPKPQPQPQPQPSNPGPAPQPDGPPPTTSTSRRSLEPVFVGGLLGLGGVGLVTGVVSGLSSSAAGSAASEQCVDVSGAFLCPEAASGDLKKERGRALLADVAYGLGSAAVVGGVAVLVIPGKGGGTTSWGVRPDGVSVTLVR